MICRYCCSPIKEHGDSWTHLHLRFPGGVTWCQNVNRQEADFLCYGTKAEPITITTEEAIAELLEIASS